MPNLFFFDKCMCLINLCDN